MTYYETIRSDYGADTKKPTHRPLQTKEHYELMTCAPPTPLCSHPPLRAVVPRMRVRLRITCEDQRRCARGPLSQQTA